MVRKVFIKGCWPCLTVDHVDRMVTGWKLEYISRLSTLTLWLRSHAEDRREWSIKSFMHVNCDFCSAPFQRRRYAYKIKCLPAQPCSVSKHLRVLVKWCILIARLPKNHFEWLITGATKRQWFYNLHRLITVNMIQATHSLHKARNQQPR